MAIQNQTKVPDLKAVDNALVRPEGTAFNPMQDLQRSQIAAQNAGLPSGGFTPPKVPTTFDAGKLGKTATIVAPPATTPAPVDPFVQSLKDSSTQYQAMQDKAAEQVKPFEEKQNALTTRLEGTLDKLTGRGQAQLDAEANLGVPEDTARLKEINLQVANLTNDFNRRIANIPGQGRGLTTGIVQGQTDRERRLAAVEIGALTSVQQALQGNIALSQQTAERTVAMEFADEEQEIQNLQVLLQLNSENLSRADKKRAEELSFSLQERERQIADAKEERKQVLNLSAEAAKNGADTSTLTQMSKAKTTEEALSIGGSFLGAEFRQGQAAFEAQQKQQQFENSLATQKFQLDEKQTDAQIRNINSEIANRGLQGDGIDGANLLAYAQQYATTGQIPTGLPKGTFGLVSEAAKELPQQKGALVSSITGIKDSKLGVAEQDDITRLYNVTENVKRLIELDKERWGGVYAGTLGKVFGSDAQAEYLTKRKAIVDDIQRMQSGAALSETEQNYYLDYLPGRFSNSLGFGQDSGKKIQNFANEMNLKLENALKTNGLSIYGYSKVKIGDQEYTVGDTIEANGQKGTVLPDGQISVQSFSSEGQTSLKGTVTKLASIPDNIDGGQCGRFVNQLTGLGVGDSYQSKMAKMDPQIKEPEPGMVFTMPYKDTGHIGFYLGSYINDKGVEMALVKDSNWFVKSAPETVRTHEIPVSKMTGFKRVNLS